MAWLAAKPGLLAPAVRQDCSSACNQQT
jgi:hypothetical protein